MTRIRTLVAVGVLLLMGVGLGAGAQAAQALPGLTTGFFSDPVLTTGSAATRAVWIPRAVDEGSGLVRVNVEWATVAPKTPPAGFDASNPSSPGYDWTSVDDQVRDLSSHGLRVLMTIIDAPSWAEGANPPASVQPGTWKPSPSAFASFARAAATRYDGSFPDPLAAGATLPRVRDWQAWNEPNLEYYLSPQWRRAGHGWAPVSPGIYVGLLNGLYSAVKAVSSSNFVVGAGTSPYGDAPGNLRMQPVTFDRYLFCEHDNTRLSPTRCPVIPHLDAVDHHPYGIGGPTTHAFSANDAAVPDYYRIADTLHAAQHAGHVLPRGPKQLWVTEISWDTNPPDPAGIPIQRQARWVEQAMYVLWSQGVDTILWLQIADSPPVPNYDSTYQSGTYYLDGGPKPSATALRFPFITQRRSKHRVLAWGRAPAGGRLSIEQLRGGRWTTIRRLSVRRRGVFEATLSVTGRAVFRAQIGSQISLPWTQAR